MVTSRGPAEPGSPEPKSPMSLSDGATCSAVTVSTDLSTRNWTAALATVGPANAVNSSRTRATDSKRRASGQRLDCAGASSSARAVPALSPPVELLHGHSALVSLAALVRALGSTSIIGRKRGGGDGGGGGSLAFGAGQRGRPVRPFLPLRGARAARRLARLWRLGPPSLALPQRRAPARPARPPLGGGGHHRRCAAPAMPGCRCGVCGRCMPARVRRRRPRRRAARAPLLRRPRRRPLRYASAPFAHWYVAATRRRKWPHLAAAAGRDQRCCLGSPRSERRRRGRRRGAGLAAALWRHELRAGGPHSRFCGGGVAGGGVCVTAV
mmetsp:Transcript_13599/g.45391  ORF Transcript_13599/g.45391 Transcript_13599/m.45391 type:complete len:325 (-) Transcript_13599:173-1147(-)